MTWKRLILGFVIIVVILAAVGAGVLWLNFGDVMAARGPVAERVGPYRFDLFRYEIEALSGKLADLASRPGTRLTVEEQNQLVEEYHRRALRAAWLENDIERIYADPAILAPDAASETMRTQLAGMQKLQEEARPLVEAILERQVQAMLDRQGLTKAGAVLPPVRFNFSDLPKYLIVSPRDRIEVETSLYLHSDLDLPTIEDIEADVAEQFDRSALVDGLGGLGVWPTMVLDDASLSWIISTIAHEWVHNYLTFHSLGWNMFDSPEMNTINETVAVIVGDEIGERVAFESYGIPIPPKDPLPALDQPLPEPDPDHFDFRTEMRRTRLKVDELLAEGQVEEAEAYMEARRREFVENGYTIRKLNQAYFAFHGSYATRPAASDPIGPKLQALRSLTPDLATFMQEVQGIRQAQDLEILLEEWGYAELGIAAPPPV